MNILFNDLTKAASAGLITQPQAKKLWSFLEEGAVDKPQFKLAHTAYYLGGWIIISAMGWFMTEAWEIYGGKAIFTLATIYAFGLYGSGYYLWKHRKLKIPGGVLATASVCMVPLAVYGFQKMMGFWPQENPGFFRGYHYWIKGGWCFMEIGTIIASFLVLRFIRFPFVLAPAAFSIYYLSMDFTPLFFGKDSFGWDDGKMVSLVFGLVMILVSYIVDIRQRKEDYAFWGYLFGVITFWGGLSLMHSDSEISKLLYCMINVLMIFISVFLRRIIFMIAGAMGIFFYIGHLATKVFSESLAFPIVLTALGTLIIFAGVYYQKNYVHISDKILSLIPNYLLSYRPPERQ